MITALDFIIEFGLIFLIVFTPLAFGTVEVWSITVLELVSAVIFLSWVFKKALPIRINQIEKGISLQIGRAHV